MSLVATHLLTGMQPPKLMSCCRDSNPHFLDFVLPGFRILRFWVQRVLVSSVWSLLWKMYEHFEHQKHWRYYAGIWDCQRILTHITLLKYMTWHDITLHCITLHTLYTQCMFVCIHIHTYIYIQLYTYPDLKFNCLVKCKISRYQTSWLNNKLHLIDWWLLFGRLLQWTLWSQQTHTDAFFSTEIKGLDQHPSKDNADCADSFYLLPKKNICWLVALTI